MAEENGKKKEDGAVKLPEEKEEKKQPVSHQDPVVKSMLEYEELERNLISLANKVSVMKKNSDGNIFWQTFLGGVREHLKSNVELDTEGMSKEDIDKLDKYIEEDQKSQEGKEYAYTIENSKEGKKKIPYHAIFRIINKHKDISDLGVIKGLSNSVNQQDKRFYAKSDKKSKIMLCVSLFFTVVVSVLAGVLGGGFAVVALAGTLTFAVITLVSRLANLGNAKTIQDQSNDIEEFSKNVEEMLKSVSKDKQRSVNEKNNTKANQKIKEVVENNKKKLEEEQKKKDEESKKKQEAEIKKKDYEIAQIKNEKQQLENKILIEKEPKKEGVGQSQEIKLKEDIFLLEQELMNKKIEAKQLNNLINQSVNVDDSENTEEKEEKKQQLEEKKQEINKLTNALNQKRDEFNKLCGFVTKKNNKIEQKNKNNTNSNNVKRNNNLSNNSNSNNNNYMQYHPNYQNYNQQYNYSPNNAYNYLPNYNQPYYTPPPPNYPQYY